ncbi:AMP-binding protein [Agrobacterium rosae]|uniref:AMP-binding protein n=1 Tax=Agrobacterium rosae TaxID=1972867 RepID=A0AAW9FK83_9HYPH|nr:AMP-binding protein [Agrobacterium rosae]MDX8305551.1 AMP-binding protein [Agrobacterium rosae]
MRSNGAIGEVQRPSSALYLRRIFDRFEDCREPCYRHPGGDLRYCDLHAGVLGLLSRFAAFGLAADIQRPVLIWGHKDHRYVIAYWACLLSGRALVPVEPETPLERVRQIAATSNACAVVIADTADCGGAVENLELLLPILRVLDGEIDSNHGARLDTLVSTAGIRDDAVAYIMFSSGTLGQPKGIQVTYANLVDFIGWLDVLLPEAASFRAVSGNIRYCFDVSLFELWAAWVHRLPMTALDHANFANSTAYIQRLKEARVALWVSTPSIVRLYLKNKRFNGAMLPDCKTFVFCGEPLTKVIVRDLFARFPGCRVVNTYGPTECTVAVTGVDIQESHLESEHELPIGYARPGTRLELAAGLEEQGAGGEIHIRGRSVGRGYVGLPEKQAAAFPESQLYRTGDWGWQAEDGLWYFKGRIDREVKIQGLRIDLDDVETHIRNRAGVEDVVVGVFTLDGQPRGLKAFVVGPETAEDLCKLSEELAEELPHYLVPKFWHAGFETRLNNNSKLDRQAVLGDTTVSAVRYVHAHQADT